MGWNPECRYKILGKLIRTQTDLLFVFDLTSAETYIRSRNKSGKRIAYYPEEWKNQFGIEVKDHQDISLVSIFDDYTVFKIEKGEERKEKENNGDDNIGYEKEKDTDLQENTSGN